MPRKTPKTGSERFPGFGDRLRLAMRRAGHRKLAALALELGVTESSLSRWCAGHEISLANAVALSRCLNVSLDWLVTGIDPVAPAPSPCACKLDRPSSEALAAVSSYLQGLIRPDLRPKASGNLDIVAQGATQFSET
jgi:transcriptional regulator with XRE-family HTH domain